MVTNGHPFYVHRARSNLFADDGEWINSDKLEAGDLVRTPSGEWKQILSINHVFGEAAVYNFEIERNHDYFVGSLGVLVHNQGNCNLIDLTDATGRTHILDDDATGGGHRFGTGISGKSEFPASWSDDEIIHNISDVATDPASIFSPGRGGRTIVNGTRNGIDIRGVIERGGTRIVTGFPTNVTRNP